MFVVIYSPDFPEAPGDTSFCLNNADFTLSGKTFPSDTVDDVFWTTSLPGTWLPGATDNKGYTIN
ncbi:hypothetical protein DF186_15075 [Enterococcus hirae]|nr:hypothetical protein DF186_15075 [Enterococcus hirae]